MPVAIKTVFGWAILGRYNQDCELSSTSRSTPIHHVLSNSGTDSILQQFWSIEEVAAGDMLNWTQEEHIVVDHFANSHIYLPTGCYQVTLPRRPNVSQLGESRAKAVQRFQANEHSIFRKGIYEAFQKVVQEYLDLDHAKPVPQSSFSVPPSLSCYLPMHAVMKESSSMTALRVVFDASAKTITGTSLNDTLLIGPTLFPNPSEILMRFRTYSIAITADISKMYRTVEICEQDRDFYRFVWRPNKTSISCSGFSYEESNIWCCVLHLMWQCKVFNKQLMTLAIFILKRSTMFYLFFYVDDCLAGADSTQEAMKLHSQLRNLLLKGGFDLRKWRSSSSDVMSTIDSSRHYPSELKPLTEDHPSYKETYPNY